METIILNVPPTLALTNEQFYDLCMANEEWRIELTAEGKLIIMSPTDGDVETISFSPDTPPNLSGESVLPGFLLNLATILNV